jgi:hypothetical protein
MGTTKDETSRKGMMVVLSPHARSVVKKIKYDTGVAHTEAMSRILEWYSSLDKKQRAAILSRDEAFRAELVGLLLKQMEANPAAGIPTPAANPPPPQSEQDQESRDTVKVRLTQPGQRPTVVDVERPKDAKPRRRSRDAKTAPARD